MKDYLNQLYRELEKGVDQLYGKLSASKDYLTQLYGRVSASNEEKLVYSLLNLYSKKTIPYRRDEIKQLLAYLKTCLRTGKTKEVYKLLEKFGVYGRNKSKFIEAFRGLKGTTYKESKLEYFAGKAKDWLVSKIYSPLVPYQTESVYNFLRGKRFIRERFDVYKFLRRMPLPKLMEYVERMGKFGWVELLKKDEKFKEFIWEQMDTIFLSIRESIRGMLKRLKEEKKVEEKTEKKIEYKLKEKVGLDPTVKEDFLNLFMIDPKGASVLLTNSIYNIVYQIFSEFGEGGDRGIFITQGIGEVVKRHAEQVSQVFQSIHQQYVEAPFELLKNYIARKETGQYKKELETQVKEKKGKGVWEKIKRGFKYIANAEWFQPKI